jgi:hypothetical protein
LAIHAAKIHCGPNFLERIVRAEDEVMPPANRTPSGDFRVIPTPEHRIIDDFVVYWNGKRAGRIAPRPGDMAISDLPAHAPNLAMVDVLDGGADFRFRYVGARIVKSLGRDSSGQRCSDLCRDNPEVLARLTVAFKLNVTEKCPIYTRGRVFWVPAREHLNFAAATLPLSDDGFNISAILDEILFFSNSLDTRATQNLSQQTIRGSRPGNRARPLVAQRGHARASVWSL